MDRNEIMEVEYRVLRKFLKDQLGQQFENDITDFILRLISEEESSNGAKDFKESILTREKKAINEMRRIALSHQIDVSSVELTISDIVQQMRQIRRMRILTDHFEAQFERDQISDKQSIALFSATFKSAIKEVLL